MKLLIAESHRFSPEALDLLRPLGDVDAADLDRAGLLARVGGCDALWVRLRHRIDAPVLDAAPRLQVIVSPTTGLNHIDLDEAARRGIAVLSLRGEREFLRDVRATAEHTLALVFALVRQVPAAAAHVREGGWDRDRFWGREIRGATIGVVGCGRLGRQVADAFLALGATVVAADPHVAAEAMPHGVTRLPLSGLLRVADIVTLHVPLDETTTGLFGADEFAAMKPGAFLVNTSRGEVLDEAALLAHLESGRLAGAALDVLSGERAEGMAGHAVAAATRRHPNLIVTPHIGGCTAESMAQTERFMARRLVEHWRR